MRHIIEKCVGILLVSLCLHALPALEPARDQFSISTCNDLFGGEFPVNRDNHRTYGSGLIWNAPLGIELRLSYYGYTDRALSLRADELTLELGYPFRLQSCLGVFTLEPVAGISLTGNLYGNIPQNLVHQMLGLNQLTFAYEPTRNGGSVQADGLAGGSMLWEHSIRLVGAARLVPALQARATWYMPSGIMLDGGPSLSVRNDAGDHFQVFAGYARHWADWGTVCLNTARSAEQGPAVGFSLRTGLLQYATVIYPEHGYANGTISLLFGSPRSGLTFEYRSASVLFDYALDMMDWGKQIRALWPVLSIKNISALPYLEYSYGSAHNVSDGNRSYKIAQVCPGLEVDYLVPIDWLPLQVFAGVDAGLRAQSQWIYGVIQTSCGAVVQLRAGARSQPIALFPNSALFAGNSRYGISLSWVLQCLPAVGRPLWTQQRIYLGLTVWEDWKE